MDVELPDVARKGRGAISNRTPRFEAAERVRIDDGWSGYEGFEEDPDLPPLRTTVSPDASRTVIARNTSPDVPFDRSINPYRGCEHGCVYCFARPTHAYLGFSPGLDFETKLIAKFDAPELLARELSAKNYRCKPIAMGTNTDPYQPIERRYGITRRILEVLERYNHPVTIVTKSALIIRDLDILGRMAERGLAHVAVSITTLDADLARRLEPRAATPGRRLATLAAAARAGVPAMVMAAPIIPALTDHELERILGAARAAGALSAGYVLLRLPLEVKDLFVEWLQHHEPGRAAHVVSLIRQSRNGRMNDPDFSGRFVGSGPFAALLASRFALACRRLGLNRDRAPLDVAQFRAPANPTGQLSLL